MAVAVPVPVFVADGALDFVLPLPPLAVRVAGELLFADAAPDDGALCCCAPLPFCVLASDAFALFVGSVVCCGDAAVGALELVPPLLSAWAAPAEPLVCPCCEVGGGGLTGAGGGLLFAGPVAPASSKAAKGWELAFWLWAEAAAEDAADETAVEALGAILGTLGTWHSENDNKNDCFACNRQARTAIAEKSKYFKILRWRGSDPERQALRAGRQYLPAVPMFRAG